MPRRPFPKVRMFVRRSWYWLTGFNWWALAALFAAVVGAALAFTDAPVNRILAVGIVAVVLAIIAPKENP